MKILYITNYLRIANFSGGFINDYLNDLLYFGLYEFFGTDVVDSTPIVSLYKENQTRIDPRRLWGGFTTFWLIDKDESDRENIVEKIKDKYFDLVIYGAIKRCDEYYNLVSMVYEPHKIILIDGDDDTELSSLAGKHPYFKRELRTSLKNVHPISFSIPTCKINQKPNKDKNKWLGTVIPGIKDTYIFNNEKDYYQDYNNSFWGITARKAGWDCLRHYEILANYCMPYFANLSNCHEYTMTAFPKKMVADAMLLFNGSSINHGHYYEILDQMFEYTSTNLTTKSVAKRLLEQVL